MNYQDIIEFVTANPACSLATSENGKPYNRGFLTNIIDNKIYFTSSTFKNVGRQLQNNPNIQLCYFSQDFTKMLRISGTVDFIDSLETKQYLIDNRDYLKGFKADDETFLLFTLKDAEATLWTLADNMKEKDLTIVKF